MCRTLFFLCALSSLCTEARAQADERPIKQPSPAQSAEATATAPPFLALGPRLETELFLRAPLFVSDAKEGNVGMTVSLTLASDLHQAVSSGLRHGFQLGGNPWVEVLVGWPTVTAVQFALATVSGLAVPRSSWAHEEFHRAVLAHNDILTTRNEVFEFKGADVDSALYVSNVSDEDLAAFKQRSAAHYSRMSSAGLEGQTELIRAIERDQFFLAKTGAQLGPVWVAKAWNAPTLWLNAINTWGYMSTCASQDSVERTESIESADGEDVLARDFTGFDCNAWVYDIHRPDEPYEDRGAHPSGVGIDRARHFDDLSPDEQAYLQLSAGLSALNFIDPNLLGINGFTFALGDVQMRSNARLVHHMAPFGNTVALDAVLVADWLGLNAQLIAYGTRDAILPGVSIDLVRLPLSLSPWPGLWERTAVHASMRTMGWLQPAGLRFDGRDGFLPGGLVEVELGVFPLPALEVFVGLGIKSEGFVAARVELEPAIFGQAGLSVAVY